MAGGDSPGRAATFCLLVPTAPAMQASNFQIEIVPADGTSAAKFKERRLRYAFVLWAAPDKLRAWP